MRNQQTATAYHASGSVYSLTTRAERPKANPARAIHGQEAERTIAASAYGAIRKTMVSRGRFQRNQQIGHMCQAAAMEVRMDSI